MKSINIADHLRSTIVWANRNLINDPKALEAFEAAAQDLKATINGVGRDAGGGDGQPPAAAAEINRSTALQREGRHKDDGLGSRV